MDQPLSGEVLSDIPDKFYFNEMKREVLEASQVEMHTEQEFAAEYIGLQGLGDLIVSASTLHPKEYVGTINSNQHIINQLWQYLNVSMNKVTERREYIGKDFRELAVATSAASIRLAQVVDTVKTSRLGREARTEFTNALTSHLFMIAATGLATIEPLGKNEPAKASFANKLADEAFVKTGMETKNISWAWAKVHSVAEMLRSTMTLREVLSGLPMLTAADTEMIGRQNDALGEAAKLLQTYTPKPSISEIEGMEIDALFVDRNIIAHTVTTGRSLTEFTQVRLFPNTTLSSSEVSLDFNRAHRGNGGTAKRIAIAGTDQSVSQCEMLILNNREVRILSQPLSDFAQKLGAEGQAEMLTAVLLSKNFDLIVPTYIVDLANEEADHMPANADAHPQADKLRRLLLARTRVLNTLGQDIVAEIDREEEEDNIRHRDIVKHGVVGHLRRLPIGSTPGQEQRILCKEQLGIDLPEGHTYVQIHQRGNLELPSRGHKVAKNPKAIGRLGINL